MDTILIIGTILSLGFLFGQILWKLGFPKVTGYILAGIVLSPTFSGIISTNFPAHTDPIVNIALSVIAFSVGGMLSYSRIKKLGKQIIYITICESEFAFIAVALAFLVVTFNDPNMSMVFIPLSLLIASLAAPTDPSATLAVVHEYEAKGEVTSTIMGITALDDVMGIINYSIAVILAEIIMGHNPLNLTSLLLKPFSIISGSILLGIFFGLIFNLVSFIIKKETEGVLIVLIISLISLCAGIASTLGVERLLTIVTMGAVVANFNKMHYKIFMILERYTEELVFVIFFTLSGMHLNFTILVGSILFVAVFVISRAVGKTIGVVVGATLSSASKKVRKYTVGGLIPQGGIVVGLALAMRQYPLFAPFIDTIISVVIGAVVVHEIIGPILSEATLKRAKEISVV